MSPTSDSSPSLRSRFWLWLLPPVVLGAGILLGWQQWQRYDQVRREQQSDATQRARALEERVDALRRDQRAQLQRLQQAEATNRVLREELLGIGQRAALLEDSVSRLADPDRHGAQALRLDETELLLTFGQQRLVIAADLDGARRAYALAAGVLGGVNDPAYLSLRQTLIQERAALDALDTDPRVAAVTRIDAFSASLAAARDADVVGRDEAQPWWRRAFGALIQVQPTDRALALHAADRDAALAGLQLELSLARSAAERRDTHGYRQALLRAGHAMNRLWPESPARQARHRQLQTLAALPLSLAVPTLGSTLQQLQQMRAAR